ncbi:MULTISPECIES: hypothetical protein [Xenorhabdus]|uniref:hypothetical protein n=1 Tax=Xenorhabdus TaxID=626 RepID=UPI001F282883|nr:MULTISPECIES: hypothetical protein [Xenorhabdus]
MTISRLVFASGDDLLMQAAVQRTQPIPRNTSTCVHSGAQISVKGKAGLVLPALSRARDRFLLGICKMLFPRMLCGKSL